MFVASAPAAFLGVALVALSFFRAESEVEFDWSNSPVADNSLGRLARACSSRHCQPEVDALDLWLSLVEVCIPVVSRALPQQVVLASNAHKPRVAAGWPVAQDVAVLAAVAVVGLFAGFLVGAQAARRAQTAVRGPDKWGAWCRMGVLID